MNLVYKKICPICNGKLICTDKIYSCTKGCYKLFDYFQIYDISMLIPFGKVIFSIHKNIYSPNIYETFIYNKAGKMIFKVDYLIPIDFKDISKFFNKIKTYLVFS